jgi:hypothetical protein
MSKSRKREEQNKIMRDSYLRTKQEAKEIKDRSGINANPILQTSQQYVKIKFNYLLEI